MVWRRWFVALVLVSGCGAGGAEEDEPDSEHPHGHPPDADAGETSEDPTRDDDDADDDDADDDGPPEGVVSQIDCNLEGTQILGESFDSEESFRGSEAFAIDQLEVAGPFLYFADRWGLQRVRRDGGPSENIVTDARPFGDGMVVHGDGLVWTHNTEAGWELQRAATAGGETSMLTTFSGYTHWLRTDGTTLVWNGLVSGAPDESRIYAWSSGDASPTVLAAGRYGWQADVDAGNVYATGYPPGSEPADGAQAVFRLRISDGSATVLASGFEDLRPAAVVATTDDVVFVVAGTSPSGLQRVAKTGGEPVDVVLGDAPVPDTLVAEGNHVVGFTVRGEVWSFPVDAEPVHLTTTDNQLYAGHVALSGDTALVVHHAHECTQLEQTVDPHTGSQLDVCRRSVTRRCIEAIALP